MSPADAISFILTRMRPPTSKPGDGDCRPISCMTLNDQEYSEVRSALTDALEQIQQSEAAFTKVVDSLRIALTEESAKRIAAESELSYLRLKFGLLGNDAEGGIS